MSLRSPFKKKAKLSAKKTLFEDEKELEEIESNVAVVEIIHAKNNILFKLNEEMKVIEVMSDIPLFVGDHVVELMGVDLRGKSKDVFITLWNKQLFGDKVAMKILRVNSPKIFLKRDIEVRYILKAWFKLHQLFSSFQNQGSHTPFAGSVALSR